MRQFKTTKIESSKIKIHFYIAKNKTIKNIGQT